MKDKSIIPLVNVIKEMECDQIFNIFSFKLVRSSSDQTPSPSVHLSPTHNPGLKALSQIRKSMREKKALGLGPRRQMTVEDVTKELENVKDDLQVRSIIIHSLFPKQEQRIRYF